MREFDLPSIGRVQVNAKIHGVRWTNLICFTEIAHRAEQLLRNGLLAGLVPVYNVILLPKNSLMNLI